MSVDLDEFTAYTLWIVCSEGPYHSSVFIDIDMVDRGRITGSARGLIEDALWDLNRAGLVRFTENPGYGAPLTRIKATPDGFAAAGYAIEVREVGASHSYGGHHPDHPGDGTDWRNHAGHAVGIGEIERLPIREHLLRHWDHADIHFDSLWEYEDLVKERNEQRATGAGR